MLIHRFRDRLRRQRLAFARLLFAGLKLLHEFVSRAARSITRDSVLVTPYAAATLLHDYVSLARQWFDITRQTAGTLVRRNCPRRLVAKTGHVVSLPTLSLDPLAIAHNALRTVALFDCPCAIGSPLAGTNVGSGQRRA